MGWRDSAAGKTLVLYAANLSVITGIAYSDWSTAKSDP